MSVNDYDQELHDAIEETSLKEDDSIAYGIAQKVIDMGFESLSRKQKYIYEKVVVPLLRRQHDANEANRLREPC